MPKRKKHKKIYLKLGLVLAIVFSLLYLARPLVHEYFIGIYKTPSLLILFVLVFYSLRYFFKIKPAEIYEFTKPLFIITTVIMLYLVGIAYTEAVIKPVYLSNSFEWNEIDKMPVVKSEHLRITPELVANYYSTAALPYPEYQMGGTDLVYVDKLTWSAPIIPDGAVNMFRLDDKGMMLVDATTIDKKITEINQNFVIGEGVLLTKSIWWQIFEKDYWIDIGDWYFLPLEEPKIIVPIIGYEFKLWIVPYTIPVFKGVYEIDTQGNIIFYSKETIEKGDIPDYLKENPLFPKELARYYAETFSWKKDLINILFLHENHIDIRDSPTQEQPFLILTENGFYWLIAAEPWGEAQGINRIFLFDATTGKIQMRVLKDPQLGPIRALGVLEAEYPIKAFGRYPLEPLPVISDDKLYWRIVVVPKELTSIAYLALVDAETNEIYRFEKDEEFFSFIEKKPISIKETPIERMKQEIKEMKKTIGELSERAETLEKIAENITE